MEVIRFGVPSERPPLLFLHGSYCGAWIWERFFLPDFAAKGWWGAAISLRGHGNSEGRALIPTYGIRDYLKDIAAGMALFDRPAVIIGHSLGGYLAQKYALKNPAAGMVLLSSPSLLGLGGSSTHIALWHPTLAVQLALLVTMGPDYVDHKVINRAFFTNPESARSCGDLLPKLQRESTRTTIEASIPDFRRPRNSVPTFVLGGSNDAFVPTSDFKYESLLWRAPLCILDGASHGTMLDDSWPEVAEKIQNWLSATFS